MKIGSSTIWWVLIDLVATIVALFFFSTRRQWRRPWTDRAYRDDVGQRPPSHTNDREVRGDGDGVGPLHSRHRRRARAGDV
jgi:hypothetical protein